MKNASYLRNSVGCVITIPEEQEARMVQIIYGRAYSDSEKQTFRHLHGPTKAAAHRRNQLDARFKKMFPKGHRESLRKLALLGKELIASNAHKNRHRGYFRGFGNIHRDAYDLLIKYGVDYKPEVWRENLAGQEPVSGKCFANAEMFARSYNTSLLEHPEYKDQNQMVYVEGLVEGACAEPMLHAWNTRSLRGTLALDWSWYSSSEWIRYFGIALTLAEYRELCDMTGQKGFIHLILHKKFFTPNVKKRLIEILEGRKRVKKKK
jgi:hypothetical protein